MVAVTHRTWTEESNCTYEYDHDWKLLHYALAVVPEAWIVDLEYQRVEVHQDPAGNQYRLCRPVARAEVATRPDGGAGGTSGKVACVLF